MPDLLEFINSKAGTMRNIDGSLKSEAGRVKSLDDIVTATAAVDSALVAALKTAAEGLSGDDAVAAKTYIG